jgi:hypothetical protein
MAQGKAQHSLCPAAFHGGVLQFGPRAFEQLSVFNAGRTYGFTSPAAQATVDVSFKGGGGIGKTSFGYSSHQIDAAARSVILVTGGDVRWASLETEAAMDARKQFLFMRREHGC